MRVPGFKTFLAIGFAGVALTAGGWKAAEGGQSVTLLNVSDDPTRELYEAINDAFAADYLKKTGTKVTIQQSHGGSGKQATAVVNGLQADVVTLGVAQDILAIQKAGLIKPGWQNKFPYNSSPYTSTVAFLVRKGNPKHIHDWKDLLRPGVQIIAPNPKISGAGRWAFLGLWGATAGAKTYDLSTKEGLAASIADGKAATNFPVYKSAAALAALTEFYKHVPVLDTGARGATVTFAQKGLGDVLLNWENGFISPPTNSAKTSSKSSILQPASSASRRSLLSTSLSTRRAPATWRRPISTISIRRRRRTSSRNGITGPATLTFIRSISIPSRR